MFIRQPLQRTMITSHDLVSPYPALLAQRSFSQRHEWQYSHLNLNCIQLLHTMAEGWESGTCLNHEADSEGPETWPPSSEYVCVYSAVCSCSWSCCLIANILINWSLVCWSCLWLLLYCSKPNQSPQNHPGCNSTKSRVLLPLLNKAPDNPLVHQPPPGFRLQQ